MKYEFAHDYQTGSEILTGTPAPLDHYIRERPAGGHELFRGRIFRAKAGDEVELSDKQAEFIRRDSPGALAAPARKAAK